MSLDVAEILQTSRLHFSGQVPRIDRKRSPHIDTVFLLIRLKSYMWAFHWQCNPM